MSEEDDDPCEEQVVVAALPGETPEVHVATLDRAAPALSLRAASVRAGGDLSLGAEKTVSLASAGSVDVSDGVVAVIGRDGGLMVQLHLETPEDLRAWADGLRAAVAASGGRAAGGATEPQEEDTDEDVVLLQARSRQLQNHIGELQAAGQRQDRQLQKMVRRLDGAMQMLTAVQDMCGQQRKVIAAQKDAIKELERECGEEDGAEADEARAAAAGPSAGAEAEDEEDEENEDEEEDGEGKAEEMLRLLQQADQMTRTLQALQSAAGSAGEPPVPPEPPPAEMEGRGGGEDDEAVLARLMRLQAEKQRFEGMLRDSQQEHEDLLERLTSMRAMMHDLGIAEEGADGSEDDEDEAPGAH